MTHLEHPALTPSQQAAVAKVACGCSRPGGVAVLCGPRGVGKSLVLSAVAEGLARGGRRVATLVAADWRDGVRSDAPPPDVVLVDDAHLADGPGLGALVDHCRRKSAVVLTGQGRLLTLIARDNRLEEAVTLRAVLRVCTPEESAMIIGRIAHDTRFDDGAIATLHEIAAGSPAAIHRLVDLARVVTKAREGRPATATDIEALHRRLSPLAA